MSKKYKVVDVRVEDKLYEGSHVIVYAREEGAVFEVLVYPTEEEVDRIMSEYQEHGTLTLPTMPPTRGLEIITPVVMFKAQTTQSLRKDLAYEEVK